MSERNPTVRDVQRRIPLVASIVAEAREAVLDGIRTVRAGMCPEGDERLARRVDDVRRCIRELQALGGSLVDPLEGVVEWRADMDGEAVILAWRPGEEGAMTWRRMDGSTSERLPLPEANLAGRRA